MTTRVNKQVERFYPLAPIQEGILFHTLYDPQSGVYFEQLACLLDGDLDEAALRRAWEQVVARHTIFRTAFVWEGLKAPVQVVYRQVTPPWTVEDWRALPTAVQEEQLAAFLAADRRRGFVLTQVPLIRLALFRIADNRYHFVWSHHHLLIDGWSGPLVFNEVLAIYEALTQGREPQLAAPRPYEDYIVWLQRQDMVQAEAFWRRALAGFSAPTPLTVDHPSAPDDHTARFAEQQIRLLEPIASMLQALARQHGLTMSTLAQGVWALLLSRYSGEQDVVFGVTVAGRPPELVGVEQIVGVFINTLPVRVQVAPTAEVLPWLRQLQADQVELRQYEYSPLVQVQGWSDVPRGQPLFESIVVFENYPVGAALAAHGNSPNLRVGNVRGAEYSNYPLTLGATADPALSLQLTYDTRRFDGATITRALGHLQTLLEGIATQSARRLVDLPLLSTAERQQLLLDWNATQAAYPLDQHLDHGFEMQAAASPDAVAVVFDRPPTTDHRPPTTDHRPTTNLGEPRTKNQEPAVDDDFITQNSKLKTQNYPHPFTPSPLHPFTCQHLTYHELDRRAAELATLLQQLGVRPEVIVGLCVERSPEMLIAVLAVLKAGGAFLPLDPSYPAPRLAYMLHDSAASILLAHAATLATVQFSLQAGDHCLRMVVCLDRAPRPSSFSANVSFYNVATMTADPRGYDRTAAHAANLAYLMYTSGSTGQPKGVSIRHRNLTPFFLWYQHYFGLRSDDHIIQYHSLSFDFSTWEIFEALLCGASLHIVPTAVARDVEALALYLERARISVLNMTPSQFSVLSDYVQQVYPTALARLRILVLGGEALSVALAQQAARLVSARCQVYNEYGPTETTISSAIFAIPIAALESYLSRPSLPIGRPIGNTQIYLLDARLRPVAIGLPGDLYIGGVGLAEGYFRRPAQTAERFVPNPFAEVMGVGCWVLGAESSNTQHPTPNTRLYRTGDRARWLADGTLEFLGRRDEQVKLRGYRIELGEIEALLRQHPQVSECVVVVREDTPDDQRLAAYIVEGSGVRGQGSEVRSQESGVRSQESDVGESQTQNSKLKTQNFELRAFLKEQLPEYMVPSAFVVLERLPLTPNGKVDRKALPAPEAGASVEGRSAAAPRTPAEELLAGIWTEVLGVAPSSLDDDFFALGGHSLLATQLISRVRKTFSVELPLRSIFEAPTVTALAQRVVAALRDTPGPQLPPLIPVPRDRPLPLSFAQQRLWFLHQLQPTSAAYHVPTAIRMGGALDLPALARSLQAVVARHDALRTAFALHGDQPIQIIAPVCVVPLPLLDLQALSPDDRDVAARRLTHAEFMRPFDLARGPTFRAVLLRLAPDDHVALLTMHHIVSDAWSMDVLVHEFATGYAAYSGGAAPALPPLPIQYADYAAWQRAWLHGALLDAQLTYWRAQLANLAPLELPADYPPPSIPDFRGASDGCVLPPDLSAGLIALSRREGATLFMTMLAAFQLLLARLSSQDDLAVGTPVAGRTRHETESLIGCFLNTLVLRTDLSGAATFRDLLARVRATCLAAYAHQDLPFETLVEALNPARDLHRNPLFDVLINFINISSAEIELPQLRMRGLEPDEPEAKFALTLYAQEQDGRISLQVVYQRARFAPARIATMLDQLQHLLGQIVAAPAQPLAAYSLVTPRTRALLPDPCQPLPIPAYPLLPALLAPWAAGTPDAVAVAQADHAWTYDLLLARATDLARALRAQGLAAGAAVAVHGPRSFGLIASMVGVLFSGGALLPLAADLPPARQRHMLQVAGVTHLLAVGSALDRALRAELPDSAVLVVDPETARIDAPSTKTDGVQLPALAPEAPAYLFFTSGTSGAPKAVLGCQRGLAHFLAWQRAAFAAGPGDRGAQLTGLSFDAVLRDVLLPFSSGATLCLPPAASDLSAGMVLPWLEQERITLLHSVPALAQHWLHAVPPGVTLHSLRWVFFSGEPLAAALVQRWRAAFPRAGGMVNLYGPTETTMVKCSYVVPPDPPAGVQPVGWPQPETQALVLAGERLCGIGELGEIVLRTPFSSLGYYGADAAEMARFRPNPFRSDAADVVYATGDTGRYGLDGVLEIVGRTDEQVKIRGVRVELAEVTAALLAQAGVTAGVVVAQRDEATSETHLVGYVVLAAEAGVTTATLRTRLSQQLPAALVPQALVTLEALPLTPNGKVDRRALPAVDMRAAAEAEAEYVAPRTPLEATLAAIWSEVLRVEQVGVEDNFFALGGHSLLTMQVVARVREALAVELPLRSVFETPTIAGLAEVIIQSEIERADSEMAAQLLADIDELSEDEIDAILAGTEQL